MGNPQKKEGKLMRNISSEANTSLTVGAKAVIMPGVTIKDGAIVAAGAIVPKEQPSVQARDGAGSLPKSSKTTQHAKRTITSSRLLTSFPIFS